MDRKSAPTLLLLLLALSACSGADGSPSAQPAPTGPAQSATARATAEPSGEPSAYATASWERAFVEASFVRVLRETANDPAHLTAVSDGVLLDAGYRSCDAMTRALPLRYVLISSLFEGATTTEDAAAVKFVAGRLLCPEHDGYSRGDE